MKNWRNGVNDAGPASTDRSSLPSTWTMIRSGERGVLISTGPVVQPLLFGKSND